MNDRFVDLGHKRSSNTKNKYVATLRSHTYFITFGADDQSKKEKKPNKKILLKESMLCCYTNGVIHKPRGQ